MRNKLKIKRPKGFQQWVGWSIKTIGSPVSGAIISYLVMLEVEWKLSTRILFGVLIAFPWFWMASKYLLIPIWNSLYIPTPDLPDDEGIIESCIYKNSDGHMYLRGHGFDIVRYTQESKDAKLSLERMSREEDASLEKVDTVVKLHYKFINYRDGSVRLNYYRTPNWRYKWPVYEYEILSKVN
ncbi:MAG: hypothetical protein JXA96_07605 [Sedimentisphaerales bacterium]|nr:hypothetical protein [Sedimentisphaerales bacterium]